MSGYSKIYSAWFCIWPRGKTIFIQNSYGLAPVEVSIPDVQAHNNNFELWFILNIRNTVINAIYDTRDSNVETFKDLLFPYYESSRRNGFSDKSFVVCKGSFNGMSSSRGVMGSIVADPIAEGRESSDPFHENRVKPLLVAALVLAIAALTSVLAACYVITRCANLYYLDNVRRRAAASQDIGISPIFTGFVFAAKHTSVGVRCINKTCILRRQPRISMRVEYHEGRFARNIPVFFFFLCNSRDRL